MLNKTFHITDVYLPEDGIILTAEDNCYRSVKKCTNRKQGTPSSKPAHTLLRIDARSAVRIYGWVTISQMVLLNSAQHTLRLVVPSRCCVEVCKVR